MSLYSAVKRALKEVLSKLIDTPVSTRASESTLASVLSKLDVTLTELRDAITATPPDNKTLADLYERLSSIRTQIDDTISSRASEATLAGILGKLNITLAELRDAITASPPDSKTLADLYDRLDSIRAQFDTALSTRASESTLTSILSKLDLTLVELRDAVRGTGDKTLTDLDSRFASVLGQLDITLSQMRDALKPTRTAPVQELSSQSIPAGETAEFTVDAAKTDGFSALVVTAKVAYNASATQGVRVRWLYSPDGTNFDSPEEAEAAGNYEDIGLIAGASRIRTILIPIFQSYVKIQVVNLDTSYAVVVDAWRVCLR